MTEIKPNGHFTNGHNGRPQETAATNESGKVRVATVWLDGCSGCHMSFLDIDQQIVAIAELVDIVYSPIVDAKKFPGAVDLTLIEGAVSSDEDEEKVHAIRLATKLLVSFGDCAVTANVPAMRNQYKVEEVFKRAYLENATLNPQIPHVGLPRLLKKARPVHEIVNVDLFLPGCPPPTDAIHFVLGELLEGRVPNLKGKTRFGA
ncbi:hydrogenase [Desulfomonile tiedjei]|uniref:Coenzyme F420-reducing hydrogenase, gamma subunit n=1 Tax=Desulfomonile tiedjei (strain ATCC 49306 / DSM 6799 / DCB-1) TaxID=706587 RepID=I4C0I9_DESTA|nr:hydrogenase [Desulfomonile tiedjei]AFM23080.1 coenzyme F420-reducing hydrogenase, gamma subunit [Desulfomonile tiedjei DSM 6799]